MAKGAVFLGGGRRKLSVVLTSVSPGVDQLFYFFEKFDSVVKTVLKFAISFEMRVDIDRFLEVKYSWHYK